MFSTHSKRSALFIAYAIRMIMMAFRCHPFLRCRRVSQEPPFINDTASNRARV